MSKSREDDSSTVIPEDSYCRFLNIWSDADEEARVNCSHCSAIGYKSHSLLRSIDRRSGKTHPLLFPIAAFAVES